MTAALPKSARGTEASDNFAVEERPLPAVRVTRRDGLLVVSSEQVAAGSGVQHKNVLELIDANRTDFEEFGQVAFETRPGYNNASVRLALLNEQQATLLMAYQRNTDQVRAFKKALVKAFYAMAKREVSQATDLSRMQILELAMAAEKDAIEQRERAERAEDQRAIESNRADNAELVVDAFTGSMGTVVRTFLGKHFPDAMETKVWDYIEAKHLVSVDPQGRWSTSRKKYVPGPRHHMPTAEGKQFLALNEYTTRSGYPVREPVVRRDREIEFITYLESAGFPSTRSVRDALIVIDSKGL